MDAQSTAPLSSFSPLVGLGLQTPRRWWGAPHVLRGSSLPTVNTVGLTEGPHSCSTELMRRVRRFQVAQYKCLVIKYAKDTRYSSSFSTHDR